MSTRFKMGKVRPAAYQALDPLDQFVSNCSVSPRDQELIRIRASQINGCAYCVNAHSSDALKQGESVARVCLVAAWREAPNAFSEAEQLLLAITEEVTLIHRQGLSQGLYEKAIQRWGEAGTADILMTIISINAWNRIGVGLKMEPELS